MAGLIAASVGDAAARPLHWVYDKTELESILQVREQSGQEHYGQFFIFPFPQVPPDLLKIFHLFYSLHFLIELIKKIF